jgi:hypothetical protein
VIATQRQQKTVAVRIENSHSRLAKALAEAPRGEEDMGPQSRAERPMPMRRWFIELGSRAGEEAA